MTIAIPVSERRLTPHFDQCEEVVIVEADFGERRIVGMQHLKPPPHAPAALPRWLSQHGAGVIIVGGMGQLAREVFTEKGIYVAVGAPSETPETLVADYLDEFLAGRRQEHL